MIKVFHSRYGIHKALKGQAYIGSDRELLSEWLGGLVGFAYVYFPQEWQKSPGMHEIYLPENLPVVLSLNGETIPRRDYDNISFLDSLAGESIGQYFCGIAAELPQFEANSSLGELAFLADGRAVFGNLLV